MPQPSARWRPRVTAEALNQGMLRLSLGQPTTVPHVVQFNWVTSVGIPLRHPRTLFYNEVLLFVRKAP